MAAFSGFLVPIRFVIHVDRAVSGAVAHLSYRQVDDIWVGDERLYIMLLCSVVRLCCNDDVVKVVGAGRKN